MVNPYLPVVYRNLPRILSLYDFDVTSDTYGLGDRYHWAWGLIDFANGTFQGIGNGVARLINADLLPDFLDEASALKFIDSVFRGTEGIIRRDGSLEEAFPYEGSYCVTALVAFDLLTTVELIEAHISFEKKDKYLSVIAKLIQYLLNADEYHAFISNHLATAVAALVKWSKVTGLDGEEKGKQLLDRILSKQSTEGWYLEYDGADPGYQSLCTYYLADALNTTNSHELKKSLKKSLEFLKYFVHPDGSFGGEYGSRNTRFYYPGGVEYLRYYSHDACLISDYMRPKVGMFWHVGLDAIDEPNLIPMFNSYCWAASIYASSDKKRLEFVHKLPCLSLSTTLQEFPEAGLIIYNNENSYNIISIPKGGVVFSFEKGGSRFINPGVAVRNKKGQVYTNQSYDNKNKYEIKDKVIIISSNLKPQTKRVFKPHQMVILRILNITLMRNMTLREMIKKILVKLLITGKFKNIGKVTRTIHLDKNLLVEDEVDANCPVDVIKNGRFVAIHMASKGYWQRSDTKGEL